MSRTIQAAGGVLWRDSPQGPAEVALVHRPRYDDWSLPKGKLYADEHAVAAALREVREETGNRAVPGRPLGTSRYLVEGEPTQVRYWSMRALGGEHVPNAEVDQVAWLTPEQAIDRVHPDRDGLVLQRFLAGPRHTWAWVLVRHASAGDSSSWDGSDAQRPLDRRGRRQAEVLASLLAAYQPTGVWAADLVRCTETVRPLAERTGLDLITQPLLSERAWWDERAAVEDFAMGLLQAGRPVVLASQAGPVPDLARLVARRCGSQADLLPSTAKGGGVVLHLTADGDRLVLAAVEDLDPPH